MTLSGRLQNFTRVSAEKYQFRCPLCGDGKEGHNKKRGAFIKHDNSFVFKCLNCGLSYGLMSFLKIYDFDLYRAAKFEKLTEHGFTQDLFNEVKKEPDLFNEVIEDEIENSSNHQTFLEAFTRIIDLEDDHPARVYLNNRHIPKLKQKDIFHSNDFNATAKLYSDRILSEDKKSAIVIPLITKTGIEFGFQARYYNGDSTLRYKSVMVDNRFTKCYGLHNTVDTEIIHVTEGAFDCMFFKNGIATLDSSLSSACDQLKLDKSNLILWYDNEPYNHEIMNLKEKAINSGYTVAFYNSDVKYLGKDINSILEKSFNKQTYDKLIHGSTFASGMKAKILLSEEIKN